MSAFLLDRDTFIDLYAWLAYGKLPMRTWDDATPGAYLIDRMKYADTDILPTGTVGHWAEAAAECITLQKSHGRRPGRSAEEAAGMAACHALYAANLRAVCARYKEQPMDGWADLAAGFSTVDGFKAMGWKASNALGILACWDYQCAEDVPTGQEKKHASIRYSVQGFRLELAEALLKGDREERGWTRRMAV